MTRLLLHAHRLALAAIILATPAALAHGADSPLQAVQAFYKALDTGDCDRALELRPGYSRARCASMQRAELLEAMEICTAADIAVLHLEVVYETKNAPGKSRRFSGHAMCVREAGAWRIRNRSFHRDRTTKRIEYLRDVAGLDPICAADAQSPGPEAAASAGAQSLTELQRAAARALEALQGKVPETGDPAAENSQAERGQPDSGEDSVHAAAVRSQGESVQASTTAADAPAPDSVEPAPELVLEPPPGMTPVRKRLQGEYYMPPQSFGAVAVVRACFSPLELTGISSEARGSRLPEPDRFPPLRLDSATKLSPVSDAYQGSIRRVTPAIDIKPVALTFNCSEGQQERSGYDHAIVDYLRQNAVPATFFLAGKWMRSHAERAQQLMADPLFEVGSLAWSDQSLLTLTRRRILNQVLWPQGQYEELWYDLRDKAVEKGLPEAAMQKIPAVPLVFRFPQGQCNADILALAASQGLPAIQWDLASDDTNPETTALSMAARIKAKAKAGSIIVCHANGRGKATAEALPLFVPWLREQGFQFITVSQLLQLGAPEATESCQP